MKEAEDDENIEEEDVQEAKPKKVLNAKRKKQTQSKLAWIGESIEVRCLLPLCLSRFLFIYFSSLLLYLFLLFNS